MLFGKVKVKEPESAPINDKSSAPKEDEYIWVKGFKGTNKEMQGYGSFQYEFNRKYVCEQDPQPCETGFHFSLNLKDVFKYYSLSEPGNRFFEVEGLVKKSDRESYGHLQSNWFGPSKIDKLAAKEIRFIRELSVEELYAVYDEKIKKLISLSDFEAFRSQDKPHINFIREKASELLTGKYSPSFITILLNAVDKEYKIIELIDKALAFYDEGLSPDMRAYLLFK